MWQLFSVESFLKISKVTYLRFQHPWLFLKEAQLGIWPWLGVNVYYLPLHKPHMPWFWATKKEK